MRARMKRSVAVLAVAVAFLTLCGCAAGSGDSTDGQVDQSQAADDGNGSGSDDGTPIDDGSADADQQTRRSGPAVDFGGPPFGEQGDPEFESDGVWCVTVGFFWGGDAPPQNVTFTVTGITSDPEGAVTGEQAVCGQVGAQVSCIGFVMSPDTPFTTCSLRVRATDSFDGTAQIGFTGTLECTESSYCDAAIERVAEPGPPIVIQTS